MMLLIVKGHHELKGVVEANATVRKTAEGGYQAVEGKLLGSAEHSWVWQCYWKQLVETSALVVSKREFYIFAVQRRLVTTKFS